MSKPPSKRILVDGAALAMQMKGVGRYTANTLCLLPDLDASNEFWILVREQVDRRLLPQNPRFHYIPFRLRNHLIHGCWVLPQAARQFGVDLAWIPYEATLGLFPCPYSLVCHDVPELVRQAQNMAGRPASVPRRALASVDSYLIRQSLRRAAVVFANSHFVGDWLREVLRIPAGRIRYAPCAPGADFAQFIPLVDREAIRLKLGFPHGYVLTFATGDQRENLDATLCVVDRLANEGLELDLVIAGVGQEMERDLGTRLGHFRWRHRARILPFYGEDRVLDLTEAYVGASVYLDLSLHEGFGMQVVEAMACGTPVVCSQRGALPEVAGEAALLVDPQDFAQVAGAVRRVVLDQELGNSLAKRGRKQAAQFTWSRTAATILEGFTSA